MYMYQCGCCVTLYGMMFSCCCVLDRSVYFRGGALVKMTAPPNFETAFLLVLLHISRSLPVVCVSCCSFLFSFLSFSANTVLRWPI
jgi:hypothetical protein